MKAIVLAAGMGTRLGPHTTEKPKCMVPLAGKPLLERQLEVLRLVADEIVVVRGYLGEAIRIADVRYYENPNYRSTGMVASLMCAREELGDDCLICYSDIVYEPRVAEAVTSCRSSIGVVVDVDYQDYWHARLDSQESPEDFADDQESLRIDSEGKITELGNPNPNADELDGRYVGLIRFNGAGAQTLIQSHDELTDQLNPEESWRNSSSFKQASMTDMLQEMIDRGHRVDSIPIRQGWLEMDTEQDYERYHQWIQEESMGRYFQGL